MKSATMIVATRLVGSVIVFCAAAGGASAQTVNLGNLFATSDPMTTESASFTVPPGGPYLGFMVRTSWEFDDGATPSSSFARMRLFVDGVGVIFPTNDEAQGSTTTSESRVITWFGNLPSVASGTSMSLTASQLSSGGFDSGANWYGTTITFIPTPGSIATIGVAVAIAGRRKRTSSKA